MIIRPFRLPSSELTLAILLAFHGSAARAQADTTKLFPLLAQALHMTPAQVQRMLATQLPSMAAMLQTLPTMQRDFNELLGTMQ